MTRRLSRTWPLLLAAWLALPFWPALSQTNPPPPPGTVEGRAPLSGQDPDQARAKALEQAFRNEVIARVAGRLPEKTRKEKKAELEDSIYSHSQEFIRRYQIVAEQTQGADYVVYLELFVADEILDAALAKGGFLQSTGAPRVFLLVLEQAPGGPAESWWKSPPQGPARPSLSELKLKQELNGRGYAVIEPVPGQPRIAPERVTNPGAERDQVLLQLQKDYHADLLLVGKAWTRPREGAAGVSQAELNLAAVDLRSRDTLFRLERIVEIANSPGADNPRQAFTRAAEALAPELLQRLAEKGPRLSAAGRPLDLIILNVFAYPVYQAVDARLRQPIPGVKAVSLRSLSPGRLIFRIQGQAEASTLAQRLTAESFPGFRLQQVEVSSTSIRLTAEPLPGSDASP